MCGSQRTVLWSKLFPSIFTEVPGFELCSPGLSHKHRYPLSRPACPSSLFGFADLLDNQVGGCHCFWCVCVMCACVCGLHVCMCVLVRGKLFGACSFFHHVGPWDQNQVLRFGSNHFYSLNDYDCPVVVFWLVKNEDYLCFLYKRLGGPRLTWNLLWSWGSLLTPDTLASTSLVLGLQGCSSSSPAVIHV